ncbi:MAG: SRPBCC domain-containing protein [Chryseolinea sp.]
MPNELIVSNTITIHASAAKVWDALVNPEQTKKYMFGCETVSEWKKGSSLLWRGQYEGKEMTFVKGDILEIKPGKHLTYTTIDPNSNVDDNAENYLAVTYDLHETNGKTELVVTQGDFSKVADGAKRYVDASNGGEGWNPILVAIRDLVEGTSTAMVK